MLSVQRLDLTLSEEDLNRLADEVLDFKDIDDLRLGLKEGVMHAALKIAKLGFTVPVEAELRLREIGTGTLRLEVDITAPALLPAAMKDIALKKVLDSLPVPGVSYHQGEVRVDLDELLGGAPVQFDLAGVEIRAGWLSLSLANLRYLPVVSTGEAATGEQVPKPVAVTGPDRALVAVPEHQDFYDRLKAQVSEQARRRLPSRLQPLVPWLLLVPDSFALLVRLMRDPRVPRRSKWITALAVAYFVDPLDLI
ncbi:MAG: YkvA family protein, partial [Bacillota bacterium]